MGEPTPAQHRSAFGGTWTDRRDAEDELRRRLGAGTVAADLQPALEHWIEHGYVLLRGAVAPALIDAYRAERDALREVLPVRVPGQLDASPPGHDGAALMLDPHAQSLAARDLLLCTAIVDWLTVIFDDAPLLIDAVEQRCATPTGAPHRDPSLIEVSAPLELAGARIVLGDGPPLTVYPGSHHLPEQPFSGVSRHFNPDRDGDDALRAHDEALVQAAAEAGIEPLALELVAGDVVLWSADLLHDDPDASGEAPTALVAHYCPAVREPGWLRTLPHRNRRLTHNGGWLVSHYADLHDAPVPGENAPAAAEAADAAEVAEAGEVTEQQAPAEPAEQQPAAPAPTEQAEQQPAVELVAEALEAHDARAPEAEAAGAEQPEPEAAPAEQPEPEAAPPTPPATPPADHPHPHRRSGGLVDGVRGLLGRRGRR